MKVIFTGAGPGDPDLLTIKAKKAIENCQICIYAGSLVSPEVVGLAPSGAKLYNSAKMNLEEIQKVFEEAKKSNTDVVRLHTGDPSVYGAILEQMDILDQMQIEYEVIPGVSSFQSAAAALKTELTVPEISQSVILTRIEGRTPVPDEQSLEKLGKTGATLCIFLSVHKMKEVAEKLIPFYGKEGPVAVVYRASWPDEKVVQGTLENIHEVVEKENISKTAMIIVGPGLNRNNPASKLYDKTFSHHYRRATS